MNKYYDEIMSLIGADEFKALIKKWDILSSNITRFPREQPILLPDLLCVGGSGVGKTKLIKLMSEYLYSKGNLVDFSGDGKFFEFLLSYVPKDAHFTELQRLEDELAMVKGFRHEYCGAVLIDIDAWVDHYKDRYFVSFMEYLAAHSDHWMIILSVSEHPDDQLRELESFLSMYLRLERVTLSMPDAEGLYRYMADNLKGYGLTPDRGARTLLLNTIQTLRDTPYFDGFKTIQLLCQEIAYQHFSSSNASRTILSEQDVASFAADSSYVKKTINNSAKKHKIGFARGEE